MSGNDDKWISTDDKWISGNVVFGVHQYANFFSQGVFLGILNII